LAKKAGVDLNAVQNIFIYGNHSPTMFPAFAHATIGGQPAKPMIDDTWYRDTYIPTVGKRGAAIIEARGLSSAASAANAAIDHIRDWVAGTGGKWVTMGVPSDGSYGIPAEIVYGVPCTCAGGQYTVVKDLPIDEFSRGKMDATLKELLEERDGVKHLLG
jgi:malate dehydrogenase